MKLRTIALILFSVILVSESFSKEKVVYGRDDRKDVYQLNYSLWLPVAKSTAAMISSSNLDIKGDIVEITGQTLEERGICKDEKFSQQISAANCSGFLVAPNLLVTAGHCVKSMTDCKKYKWVFDYDVEEDPNGEKISHTVTTDSVFSCKKIIKQSLDNSTMDDFALIELDRVATNKDRVALRVRTQGQVPPSMPVVVIGHPTGLPTKIAGGARTRGLGKEKYFVANLDTFGGNSGSAVFNGYTGTIEGILVRGEQDYAYDYQAGCNRPNICKNAGCRGEDVTRITNIKILKKYLPYAQ